MRNIAWNIHGLLRNKVITIATLLALLVIGGASLLQPGLPKVHDAESHVTRIMEFGQALADGQLPPRWASRYFHGIGSPVIMLNYHLPYYHAQLFTMWGVSAIAAFRLTLWSSFVLSGLGMYWVLRRWGSPWAALMGAMLYTWAPYRFVNLYVRGAFGESYAYLFVPFILYGLVSRHRILTVVAFAALFLSHPVASALFSAVVLGIVVLQALGRSRPGIALREILGFFFSSYLWAFALASYNLVPTLLMTRYTYYAPGNTIPFEHFPTLQQLLVDAWGYGYSVPGAQDNMSFAVGYAQLVVIVLALGALFLRRKRSSGQQPFPAFTIAGILLMFFLACGSMLAASMPLWAVLHFTAILDFPWRLLLVVPFLAALVGFWLTNQIKSTYVQIAVVLGVLVVAVVSQYRHARVGEHWSWGMEHFAQEMDTGDAYGEYAARWRQTRSKPTVGGRFEVLSGEAASTVIVSTSHELSLAVSASTDVTIRLNIMYFPGWRVWLNNEEQTVESGSGRCSISTDDADDGNDLSGLIVCRVSPGHNTLRALYTHTWEQLLGLALTIAALILLIWKPLRSFFPLITKR